LVRIHTLLGIFVLVAPARAVEPSLELIMADAEWMGRFPEDPRWSEHGMTVLFDRVMAGCKERETVELDLATGEQRVVADEELPGLRPWSGVVSPDGRLHVYLQSGDIFVSDLAAGGARRLTTSPEEESSPAFLADSRRVQFRRGETVLVHDLATGLESEVVDLRAEDEPGTRDEESHLRRQELETFEHLRDQQRRDSDARQRSRERAHADPARPRRTFFLGKDRKPRSVSLSPSGRFALVAVAGKGPDDWDKAPMATWINESARVETKPTRAEVGTGVEETERLVLLDLEAGMQATIDLEPLPGIDHDPLAARREASKRREAALRKPDDGKEDEKRERKRPGPRPVSISAVTWNRNGTLAGVQVRAADNKDRWIALLDPLKARLEPVHQLHDDAWVGWDGDEMGFVGASDDLWLMSEETGWQHLYVRSARTGKLRALTTGRHVVDSVVFSRDGHTAWLRSNAGNPGVTVVERVDVATGRRERVTRLGGRGSFGLSPDERQLLLLHSTSTSPPELHVQDAAPDAPARALTDSRSDAFRAVPWIAPALVDVPSRHGAGAIHARAWLPPVPPPAGGRPGVLFVHGAGYLQDAHEGWSGYFRESMFATLLARRGFVVVSPDYRASAGYGRDWRTAIHLRMGEPEVEDVADVIDWMVEAHDVDRARVGAWGGSYGGFLVLMTMFRRPELLAAGAALRPVTDWAHYNHPYTSSILETPELAPEAYRASSPITWAGGLRRPLLICAPMVDDNVFFHDSVRLVQRLIELEKTDWEIALYPVEPHGFREPSSWLDEYRRILKLFETHLLPAAQGER
jgi:dipeptidyl aminopeptidase/acylaminoacyl peptidase